MAAVTLCVCACLCAYATCCCWCCVQGPGAPSAGPAPEITCVAWNKKVQHILASTQVCVHVCGERRVIDACGWQVWLLVCGSRCSWQQMQNDCWPSAVGRAGMCSQRGWQPDAVRQRQHTDVSAHTQLIYDACACVHPARRIHACVQVDGATVVWDLKKQRPVITLKDPNR